MRKQLIQNLLNIIGDYNMSQGLIINEDHIEKWVSQFHIQYQDIILQELIYIFQNSYATRIKTKECIKSILTDMKVFGKDIENSIKKTTFLRIQKSGNSQTDLLDLVKEVLRETYNINIDECGSNEMYFYIDDCIFTGNKFKYDIKDWIDENNIKSGAKLISYHVAQYSQGADYSGKFILQLLNSKGIKWEGWYHLNLNSYKNSISDKIDVLWPKEVQDENVQAYIEYRKNDNEYAKRGEFYRRCELNAENLFSSKQAREIVENEFLKVGAELVMRAENPSNSVRPIGFEKLESLGFGAMFVTYRNISNNCPLALWYGDVRVGNYSPLGIWYPLFPRIANNNGFQ
jgi:hypothetical protein